MPRPAGHRELVCALLLLVAMPAMQQRIARAAPLNLSLSGVIDISGLGFNSVGGMAFDDVSGRLWLSDSTGQPAATNLVVAIDPTTGNVLQSFDASVVPNLLRGADALAIEPATNNLFLFSSFGESVAGEITQSGTFVQSLSGSGNAGAAAFAPSGTLLTLTQDSGQLQQVDPATGDVLSTSSLIGYTGRISAADFDPVSGRLFAYGDATDTLLEIDVATAQVLSQTDVSPYLLASDFPTGFAFNADGSRLYLARGTGAGAEAVLVFDVATPPVIPEPSAALLAMFAALSLGVLTARRRR